MLTAIAIVPSPPVMVPELAGAAAAEVADLRTAAVTAAGRLAGRWVTVGVDATDAVFGPESVGTFAGYGVDVPVRLSDTAAGPPEPLPLCALIAGWLRGLAATDAAVEVRTYAGDTVPADALTAGRALRRELDTGQEPVGVLVVADGANTLTPAAPGGHDPDSVPVQAALSDALAAGDCAALAALPAGIVGRVAYQVLAGLADPGPTAAELLYRGAPFGVGYTVASWTP
ncbi:hypothetical protein FK535_10370 [Mycolicibacterium sp. 018/SC-01/001]|uniref:hypothetical protein n=1 Tax=Mycolicibacterium sp. 018/SC-01/001 TaxID=2592069 RepID=UPI00117E0750|nr:hypothetical protein [Mycolicibacterium sp. 018/SC-01/001]TRW84877.1 hypothetical protein FK535_10370 [Mycolicibacterium sp. 018/SC-01/001]